MFRKLFVLSVSALILTGFNDKKVVTEDMLVGKWECEPLHEYMTFDEKGEQVANKNTEIADRFKVNFSKKNGLLIESIKGENDHSYIYKVKSETHFISLGREDLKYSDEFVFISDNEFKKISDSIFRDNKTKIKTVLMRIEWYCQKLPN